MSKIKNGGLDQYGTEHFEQQQSGTAGVEGVKDVEHGTAANTTTSHLASSTLASTTKCTSSEETSI